MAKKKADKPKHSLDVNRANKNGSGSNKRTAATVRRLKMYNTCPERNAEGKILRITFGSDKKPDTRIQPDRRWFGML